ncbi:MAG TPA: dephospho-CoA kinase [Flavobacteriales bacterium]|nr:dephospho-CoA kinase [Flavobacteriales bacterium]
MLKIGLTGGIGSGKSTVARIFQSLGVPIFNADAAGRSILEEADTQMQLVNLFGPEVLLKGKTQRSHIAQRVFGNANLLSELNSIVHPKVGEVFRQWINEQTTPYILKEAAIIFEVGTESSLDDVILVSAPEEIRIRRVMERDGVNRDQVEARMRNQWPEERKKELAAHSIVNDGVTALIPQVMKLHEILNRRP